MPTAEATAASKILDGLREMQGREEERAAIAEWCRLKAAEYKRLASAVDKLLDPIGRAKTKSTEMAFRFVQHAITRGDHLPTAGQEEGYPDDDVLEEAIGATFGERFTKAGQEGE